MSCPEWDELVEKVKDKPEVQKKLLNAIAQGYLLSDVDDLPSKVKIALECITGEHAASSSLSRISSEILVQIFALVGIEVDVQTGLETPWSYATILQGRSFRWPLVDATHVCSRWRTIAVGTPSLWTHPPPRHHAWMEETLNRNLEYPLHINVVGYKSTGLIKKSFLSRAKHLQVDPGYEDSEPWFMMRGIHDAYSTPMPFLTKAHIDAVIGDDLELPNIFGGQAPLLRELTLNGFVPGFEDPLMFSRLTHLRLVSCGVPGLYHHLHSAQNLVLLELRETLPVPGEEGLKAVLLPRLKYLCIGDSTNVSWGKPRDRAIERCTEALNLFELPADVHLQLKTCDTRERLWEHEESTLVRNNLVQAISRHTGGKHLAHLSMTPSSKWSKIALLCGLVSPSWGPEMSSEQLIPVNFQFSSDREATTPIQVGIMAAALASLPLEHIRTFEFMVDRWDRPSRSNSWADGVSSDTWKSLLSAATRIEEVTFQKLWAPAEFGLVAAMGDPALFPLLRTVYFAKCTFDADSCSLVEELASQRPNIELSCGDDCEGVEGPALNLLKVLHQESSPVVS